MALIKCPECNTEVSDQADACPKCAYPISGGRHRPVQTVEQTGKKFKLQLLISVLMIATALVIIITQISRGQSSEGIVVFAPLLLLIGLIWFIVIRFFAWWSHG